MTKAARPLRRALRVLLAGPFVLITSVATVCGSALWLPPGAAGINQLMLPMILFPVTWASLFLHACLDRLLSRALAVQLALLCSSAVLLFPRLA